MIEIITKLINILLNHACIFPNNGISKLEWGGGKNAVVLLELFLMIFLAHTNLVPYKNLSEGDLSISNY